MTFKEPIVPAQLCFIISHKWNYSHRTIKAESYQKSKWLKSTLQDRHENYLTYRSVFSYNAASRESPVEREMKMMIIIMILDLCALLFCQMNSLNPAAFSYEIKMKNILYITLKEQLTTTRPEHRAQQTEYIKVWREISCMAKQAWETYMELLRLLRQKRKTDCMSLLLKKENSH